MPRSTVVIGAGKFAADCIRSLLRHQADCVRLVVDVAPAGGVGASLSKFCERRGLDCIRSTNPNDVATLEAVAAVRPDLGLSLNNFSIMRRPLLAIPPEGVINFHNGPLPQYAGVNVCSWALINGEREYGVTLHHVDEGIDTGDIVAQSVFPIEDGWTVLELTRRCIAEGVDLFASTVPEILSGGVTGRRQCLEQRSYFSRRDSPNDGRLDFSKTGQELDRLVRALRFYPFENKFVPATCGSRSGRFTVLQIEPRMADGDPPRGCGVLRRIESDALITDCADGEIAITEVLDRQDCPASPGELAERYAMKVGDSL
jgi:methionyl-tRNA formyltransferase